ncbi:hypothetical protein [Streptomyces sp. SP18BB07]|uniref:hypothetical protein n=1 Tax=Streptomyces sp. SP18BB07 TaxID=3002522 RepID=UPI002E7673F5|nr:hypothetical protein [Streptomyces sp. SP18BB07]MEE1762711.1 hypothetical protein [Streptomyces sp. SP18BB07]
MAGIQDPRERADIAEVMEEVSGFTTILVSSHIMRQEFEAALDRVFSTTSPHLADIDLLGHGVGHAMGKRGGLYLRSHSADVTENVRANLPRGATDFDAMLSNARRQLERAVLQGPTDAEAPDLAARGWDPTVARTIAEQRAEAERQQVIRLDNTKATERYPGAACPRATRAVSRHEPGGYQQRQAAGRAHSYRTRVCRDDAGHPALSRSAV